MQFPHDAPAGRAASLRGRLAIAALAVAIAAAATLAFALSSGRPGSASAGPGSHASLVPAGQASSGPASLSAAPHADPFGAAARAYLRGRRGSVLAAAYDVSTGQTWALSHGPRGGRPQAEASVVKLDVLEALLSRASAGGRTPAPGAVLPARDRARARRMIEDSDNDAATSLWRAAGGPAGIGGFNATAGLVQTSPSRCVRCPGFPWPGWGLTTTVPEDQLTLLRELVAPGSLPGGADPGGSLLTAVQRRYVLGLMEHVTRSQRWGVPSGAPAGVTVAVKDGWLPLSGSTDWQVNTVGWVSGGGRDYLLAVLSTGSPSERYGIATVSRLSAMAWRAMR